MVKKLKSIMYDDLEHCCICGRPYPQIHHCYFGTANRKISDKYGFIIPLCQEHHTGDSGVHQYRELDLTFKRMGQEIFEDEIGSRDEFRRLFGKSYL